MCFVKTSKPSKLVLEPGIPHDVVISAVLRKLADHPPFRTYSLAVMVNAVMDQLRHGGGLMGLRDGNLVAYAGWIRVSKAEAEAWRAGNSDIPAPDWDNGEAAISTIIIADDPRDLPVLLRGISRACDGVPVYRMRVFTDGRDERRRKPITGRQSAGTLPLRSGNPAELGAFARSVWSVALGQSPRSAVPIRIVDDPATVKEICAAPDRFPKNYAFLEALGHGRFSENGNAWPERMALTQPSYSRNDFLRDTARLEPLYDQAFSALRKVTPDRISAAVIDVAIAVVSTALGLERPVPWSYDWAERVRTTLGERQWIGFYGTTQNHFDAVQQKIDALRSEIAAVWQGRPDIVALLDGFRAKAGGIADFDPVQELIQNLIASSETTAATVLWSIAILGLKPDLQTAVRSGALPAETFVREVLRLYPPVPFVTRFATENITVNAESFVASEPLLVSVLGLHYSAFWRDPTQFDPYRAEYDDPRHRDHYLPFLTGPRACGGRRLAEAELATAVRTFCRLFEFAIKSPSDVSSEYGLSFRPAIRSLTCRALVDA